METISKFVCVGLLVAASSVAIDARQAAPAAPRKPRVAIVDFDYATVYTGVSAVFGTNVDIGKGVADLLLTYLVKDSTYSVIERAQLDRILKEQNFSTSDRSDPGSAARIGKLLGVDAIIVGSITQFGNDTKSTGVGTLSRILGVGVDQKQSKAIVGLTARIVNVENAEVLAVAEGKGESKRTSTALLGAVGGSNFGAGGVNLGSSEFQSTIIGEATTAAVSNMSVQVIGGRTKITTRAIAVAGLVAAVMGQQVIINVGTSAGVKVGDELAVERPGESIPDPATGKVLRQLTTPVGVIRIIETDAGSAVGNVVSGAGFQVRDIVRSMGQ